MSSVAAAYRPISGREKVIFRRSYLKELFLRRPGQVYCPPE